MVGRGSWRCQPWYPVPSYSMSNRRFLNQYSLLCREEGRPRDLRYFVTVLLAMSNPCAFKRSAISSSLKGDLGSSFSTISFTFCFTLTRDSEIPFVPSIAPVKKNLIGKIPRWLCAYFSAMARLTVETSIPSESATSCILSGLRWLMPKSRKSFWRSTISRQTRYSVFCLCSIASMRRRADSSFFLIYSRTLALFFSFS